MVHVEIDTKKAVQKIRRVQKEVSQAKDEFLTESMGRATEYLLDYMPEQTGTLKDSIEVQEKSETGYILAVTAPYARYVEEGTGRSVGRYSPKLISWNTPEKRKWPGARFRKEYAHEHPEKVGYHPGTKAFWYRRKARADMREKFPDLFRVHIYRLLEGA